MTQYNINVMRVAGCYVVIRKMGYTYQFQLNCDYLTYSMEAWTVSELIEKVNTRLFEMGTLTSFIKETIGFEEFIVKFNLFAAKVAKFTQMEVVE